MNKQIGLTGRMEKMWILTRFLFSFWLMLGLSQGIFTQSDASIGKSGNSGNQKGLEIVFVVDVSYSMKNHLGYVSIFIGKIFEDFGDTKEKSPSQGEVPSNANSFHLITFSDYGTYKGPVKNIEAVREKLAEEIEETKAEVKRKSEDEEKIKNDNKPKTPYLRQNTYPKQGLWEVLTLIEKNFITKRGVVMFFSDGEDSRIYSKKCKEGIEELDDLKVPVDALKNLGFNVFSIFVDTKDKNFVCPKRMEKIGEYGNGFYTIDKKFTDNYETFKKNVNSVDYNSPVLFNDHLKDRKEWERKFKIAGSSKGTKTKWPNELGEKLSFERVISQMFRTLNSDWARNLEFHNRYYESKIRTMYWIYGIVIFIISLLTFFLIGVLMKRKKTDDIEENKEPLNMLWGKLIPNDKEFKTINLSEVKPNLGIELGKNFPVLKFAPYNYKDKKAIKIDYDEKNWRIRFIYKRSRGFRMAHHIDKDTDSIKIFSAHDENISCTFKYEFLQKFSIGCCQAVYKSDEFKGREDIVECIKNNFLDNLDCHNYLISGMGNAGKTSLLKHLFNVALEENEKIKKDYDIAFVAYNKNVHKTFTIFETEIFDQLPKVNKRPKKLILIDEYDKVLKEFDQEFPNFLSKYNVNNEYYYIFAGRKGKLMLDTEDLLRYIPKYTHFITLGSLDTAESIAKNDYQRAVDFLENILKQIGFPSHTISREVRERIVIYSSGFPALIKEILLKILTEWQDKYFLHPIKGRNVEESAAKIKKKMQDFLLDRVVDYEDKIYPDKNKVPKVEVTISEILKIIRTDLKDVSEMGTIVNALSVAIETDIIEARKINATKKLELLQEMGFVAIVDEKIIRLPAILY